MGVDKVGGSGGGWWENLVNKVRPVTPAPKTAPVKPEAPVYDSRPFEDYSLEKITPEQAKKLLEDHSVAFTKDSFEKYGLKGLREELQEVAAGEGEGRRHPILEHAGITIARALARANETTALGSYPDSYAIRLFGALNADAKALAETLRLNEGVGGPGS